ncbi:MAG: MFS transporter [Chloroflexi bacterium]|nr:MFS transporter [Chloroflexota bacterium]
MKTHDLTTGSVFRRSLASSPLRYGDFRALWLSTVFTGASFIGETVVLGWLLLERTDSAFVVGLGVALRALPGLLLGIPGGALADRVDRRLLIRLGGFALAADAALLGGLALAGQLAVWHILLLTFLGGCIRTLSQAARQSYAFDIVGPAQVVGAMAFMTLGQRVGGMAGSLGAGLLLAAWGAGEAYLAMALCHVLSIAAVMLARTRGQAAPVSRPPVWDGIKEYLTELSSNRSLGVLVALTAAVEVFGFSNQAVMPSLARDLLDLGPGGLGLLNAFASGGGMVAILTVSLWGEVQRKGRTFLIVVLFFGAALVLLGLADRLAVALIAVALVNGLAALTDLLSQSLVQSAVANDLRGRAMGSWVLAIGLGPVGHLQIGALAALMGVSLALIANGALLMALALGVLLAGSSIRRL